MAGMYRSSAACSRAVRLRSRSPLLLVCLAASMATIFRRQGNSPWAVDPNVHLGHAWYHLLGEPAGKSHRIPLVNGRHDIDLVEAQSGVLLCNREESLD
jgi:hypothetical protein